MFAGKLPRAGGNRKTALFRMSRAVVVQVRNDCHWAGWYCRQFPRHPSDKKVDDGFFGSGQFIRFEQTLKPRYLPAA